MSMLKVKELCGRINTLQQTEKCCHPRLTPCLALENLSEELCQLKEVSLDSCP